MKNKRYNIVNIYSFKLLKEILFIIKMLFKIFKIIENSVLILKKKGKFDRLVTDKF